MSYAGQLRNSRFAGQAMGVTPNQMEVFRSNRTETGNVGRLGMELTADDNNYSRQREFSRLQRDSNRRIADAQFEAQRRAQEEERARQSGNAFGGILTGILGSFIPGL